MLINAANLQALRTTLQKRFREAYDETPAWYTKLATEIPSSNASSTYGWIANAIRIREWLGQRVMQAMSEHEYILANIPFEATFGIKREQILDDNLGIYTSAIVPQFAAATKKHPDTEIVSRVIDGNPLAFDGKAFWAEDHPTFAPSEFAQTYSNLFTLELGPTLEEAIQTLTTIRSAMRTIVGENGLILSNDPLDLVVPPQLETMGWRLQNTTQVSNDGPANPFAGRLKVHVVEEMGTNGARFLLNDSSKPIRPFIWQVRSKPILRSRDTGEHDEAFYRNEYVYGIDGDDGGPYRAAPGVSLPFLSAMSDPST